jgi:hypothetical protein
MRWWARRPKSSLVHEQTGTVEEIAGPHRRFTEKGSAGAEARVEREALAARQKRLRKNSFQRMSQWARE